MLAGRGGGIGNRRFASQPNQIIQNRAARTVRGTVAADMKGGSMAAEPDTGPDLLRLKTAVREAVETGRDLQARVRDLMLAAFSSTGVDLSRIQQVTRTTLEGVDAGAATHGADSARVARQAVAGIEDALMQAAEASSLAIQEAAGHASDFARSDLKRAVDELASLESLFIDTLTDVARAGSTTAKITFADIQRHLQHSGTIFGARLATQVGSLREVLSLAGREGLQSGVNTAGKAAEQLGRIAGALLAGMGNGFAQAGTRTSGADDPGDKESS